MKIRDIISSLFWMLMGAGITYSGYSLDLGHLHEPGSGFMFFGVGIIMMILSLSILFRALREKSRNGEMKEFWFQVNWRKVLWVLMALFLYAFTLKALGFILCTILLLVFLFKAIEPQKWSTAILGAVLSSLSAYLLFQIWLGSLLPKGFFSIG